MVKVTVKGGTPEGCESLCRSCTRGHIITGFRASEEEVFFRTFYIEREIHFPVRECTLRGQAIGHQGRDGGNRLALEIDEREATSEFGFCSPGFSQHRVGRSGSCHFIANKELK
jgi:hypothetical protein